MPDRELAEGELEMEITQLIGLGEVKRRIYESLESAGLMTGNLKNTYEKHQEEQEYLIKYQKALT